MSGNNNKYENRLSDLIILIRINGGAFCRCKKVLTLTFLQIEVAKRCTKLFKYYNL